MLVYVCKCILRVANTYEKSMLNCCFAHSTLMFRVGCFMWVKMAGKRAMMVLANIKLKHKKEIYYIRRIKNIFIKNYTYFFAVYGPTNDTKFKGKKH